jgi:hypothetical protein
MSDLLIALRARIAEQQKPKAPEKRVSKTERRTAVDYQRVWVPLARVTRVATQHCRCCGNKTQFIAGHYVYLRSGGIHRIALESSLEASLQVAANRQPASVEELEAEVVAECPLCLGVGDQSLEELISRIQAGSQQQELWGDKA